jgi:hypothetical protein
MSYMSSDTLQRSSPWVGRSGLSLPWKAAPEKLGASGVILLTNSNLFPVGRTSFTDASRIAVLSTNHVIEDVTRVMAEVRPGDPHGNGCWDHACNEQVPVITAALELVKNHWSVFGKQDWAATLRPIVRPQPMALMNIFRECLDAGDGTPGTVTVAPLADRPAYPAMMAAGGDVPAFVAAEPAYSEQRMAKLTSRRDAAREALNDLDARDYYGETINPGVYRGVAGRAREAERQYDAAAVEMNSQLAMSIAGFEIVAGAVNALSVWEKPRLFTDAVKAFRKGWRHMQSYGEILSESLFQAQREEGPELIRAAQGVVAALACFDDPVDRNWLLLNSLKPAQRAMPPELPEAFKPRHIEDHRTGFRTAGRHAAGNDKPESTARRERKTKAEQLALSL